MAGMQIAIRKMHANDLDRVSEMKTLGILTVRTDADRPEAIAWYMKKFGCRIVGSKPKKHAFGLEGVDAWTVLELDLRAWTPNS